jgi:hypothetical protein
MFTPPVAVFAALDLFELAGIVNLPNLSKERQLS